MAPDTLRRFIAPGLLLAGLLLRVWYLYEFSSSSLFRFAFGPDVSEYHAWAMRIAAGEMIPPEAPIHAPLYAYFLAAIYGISGMSIPVVRAVQLLLNYLAFAGIYFILRKREEEWRPRLPQLAEIFLAIAMLYVPLFYYQAELVSEALLAPLLALALWAFGAAGASEGRVRNRRLLAGGVVCGLAAITHPMALGFAGLEFIYWLRRGIIERKLHGAFGFAAAVLLVVLPVSFCNSRLAGKFILIQDNSAFNFFLGNNPQADGGCYLRPGRPWQDFHSRAAAEAKASGITKDSLLLRRVAAFYSGQPYMLPYLAAVKAVKFFSPRELVSGADPSEIMQYTNLQKWNRFAALLLLPCALLGLAALLACRKDRGIFIHFILLFAGFFAMQVMTVTSGRYRSAAFIALFMFAAYFIARLRQPAARRTKWIFAVAALLLYATMAVYYAATRTPPAPMQTESAALRGLGYAASGNYRAAITEFETARAFSGDPAFYAANKGKCHEELGELPEAEAEYRMAVSGGGTDRAEALVNLANLCSGSGRAEEAAGFYAAALANPDSGAPAHYNYGIFLLKQHDADGAAREFAAALKIDPGHVEALNMMGVMALANAKPDYAADFFAAASRLKPDDPRYLGNLVVALRRAGRLEELRRAEAGLKKLMKKP